MRTKSLIADSLSAAMRRERQAASHYGQADPGRQPWLMPAIRALLRRIGIGRAAVLPEPVAVAEEPVRPSAEIIPFPQPGQRPLRRRSRVA